MRFITDKSIFFNFLALNEHFAYICTLAMANRPVSHTIMMLLCYCYLLFTGEMVWHDSVGLPHILVQVVCGLPLTSLIITQPIFSPCLPSPLSPRPSWPLQVSLTTLEKKSCLNIKFLESLLMKLLKWE